MKRILIFGLVALLGLTFNACEDSTTDPDVVDKDKGSIVVTSNPVGATIFMNDTDTGKLTPHTFTNQDLAIYKITLYRLNYADTSLFIDVLANTNNEVNVEMVPLYQNFTESIRLWETTGTTVNQPSGLDLSDGRAYGTSDAANRGKIDLYYFSKSDGTVFLVQSAHLNENMTRNTSFKVSSAGTNLTDGVDSGTKDASWSSAMSDLEDKYVFLYDEDKHYSKLKIVNRHLGAGPGDPSWVEVQWIYNKAVDNVKF